MILRGDDHRRSTGRIPRGNPGSVESNNNKSGKKEEVKDETTQKVTIDAGEGVITCTVLERVRALAGNTGIADCCLRLGWRHQFPKPDNQNENLEPMVHVFLHNGDLLLTLLNHYNFQATHGSKSALICAMNWRKFFVSNVCKDGGH